MDKAISSLGLFEIVGYLIAGILFEAFISFPWLFDPQLNFKALQPLTHIGGAGYVVLTCVAYLAGIVISELSMLYYDGGGPIKTPKTHPTRKCGDGPKPTDGLWMPAQPLWRGAHNKLRDRGVFDTTTLEAQLEPCDLQDIYMAQGYSSSNEVVMLLRIASVVRLAASTIVSCFCGILSCGATLICRHWTGQLPNGTLTFLCLFLALCIITAWALHKTSMKYAESFWRHLSAALIVQTGLST